MKYIVFLVLISFTVSDHPHHWELIKNNKGVSVYNRKVEGKKIKEFKAEMIVGDAHFEEMWRILKDVENYDKWIDRCVESKLIRKEGENVLYTYHKHDAPWPTRDRDNAAKMIYKKSSDHFTVKVINMPEIVPEEKGHYRIKDLRADWSIEKMEGGKIKITEIVWFDPGAVPAFIVNMATSESPFKTFVNLRGYLGIVD